MRERRKGKNGDDADELDWERKSRSFSVILIPLFDMMLKEGEERNESKDRKTDDSFLGLPIVLCNVTSRPGMFLEIEEG